MFSVLMSIIFAFVKFSIEFTILLAFELVKAIPLEIKLPLIVWIVGRKLYDIYGDS